MIPADRWHDNGDGTAWLVVEDDGYVFRGEDIFNSRRYWSDFNWHCGNCKGRGDGPWDCTCQVCGGTGRYVFDLQILGCAHSMVEPCVPSCEEPGMVTYIVSIIPNMILPLTDDEAECDEQSHIVLFDEETIFICSDPSKFHEFIELPRAAKLGMYAIKLQIHEMSSYLPTVI